MSVRTRCSCCETAGPHISEHRFCTAPILANIGDDDRKHYCIHSLQQNYCDVIIHDMTSSRQAAIRSHSRNSIIALQCRDQVDCRGNARTGTRVPTRGRVTEYLSRAAVCARARQRMWLTIGPEVPAGAGNQPCRTETK